MWLAYYVHHLNPFLIRVNDQFGIRWYGVAYLCGFVAAFYLLKWLARKGYGSLAETQVADFAFYGALFGVLLGGRLGYVIFYRPQMLTTDPLGILRVWDGGMASHGGILGLFLFSWVYSRRHKISWTRVRAKLVSVGSLPGPLTGGQFLSLFMFFIALGFFWWAWKTRPKEMTNDK